MKTIVVVLFTIFAVCNADDIENDVTKCVVYGTKNFCANHTSAKISKTIGSLKQADFPRMANVRTMELTANNLTEIEPRFFNNFPNLTKLIISGNDRFPTISKELLKHCKRLVNLKIFFNYNLHQIEENVLRNFPRLEKLVIKSERIYHLRKHDLDLLAHLKVLKLELTTIKKIDANAFEPIGNLEKLSLMANNYLKINTVIFNSVPKLRELNLVYAEITNLDFLKKLPKLQILQLAGNKINSISADTFEGLANLRELDLAHTGISHIDTSAKFFSNLPRLERVDLTCHKLNGELFDIVKFYYHDITVLDKFAGVREERLLACD